MNTKERYLQFPLYLMGEFFIKPDEVMSKVIKVGILRFAQTNYSDYEGNKENIAKQLLYGYYRDKNIDSDVYNKITDLSESGIIDLDTDYNGFNGDEFNPEYELPAMINALNDDDDLREYAVTYYGMKVACGNENLSINQPDIDSNIKTGLRIIAKAPAGDPWCMVNKNLAFDFRDHKKQDFELAQLAAYIACKSITGKKDDCKTNNKHIAARMFGYGSVKQLPVKLPKEIQPYFDKYSTRYWMDKVLTMLELHWGLKKYSHNMRGFYISTSKNSDMNNLALKAETQKKKNKIAALKQMKKDAREKALQQLNSNSASMNATE